MQQLNPTRVSELDGILSVKLTDTSKMFYSTDSRELIAFLRLGDKKAYLSEAIHETNVEKWCFNHIHLNAFEGLIKALNTNGFTVSYCTEAELTNEINQYIHKR